MKPSLAVQEAIDKLTSVIGIDISGVAETLANSQDPTVLNQARIEVRKILDAISSSIILTLTFRQTFMGLIAASKKTGDPILQLEREFVVIDNAGELAERYGEDGQLAKMVMWMITAIAKEKQRKILGRESVFVEEYLSPEDGRKNLLELTKQVAATYDHYGDKFSATRITRMEEWMHIKSLAESIDNRGLAIDLGTANGSIARQLKEIGFRQVHGYDISPDMIHIATSKNIDNDIHYASHDISTGIPVENEIADLIVASFGSASEVHPDIISEVGRALRPGGQAWLSFYNKEAFAHIWWQPQQTSMEVIYNPLAKILEVPIEVDGKMKVYKILANAKSFSEIKKETESAGLTITNIESFPLLATMMPPVFFDNPANEKIAIEYDRGHGSTQPYRGYYLNVAIRK